MSKSDSSITPMGRKRDRKKDALDRQTAYFTLLPHMDEGFYSGYHQNPGIVSDQNQKPREWLENMAKYMQTQGEDVGYSIPDVLAAEQQLRRLSRLPHEVAMRHQEMIDYRAVLAIMLLWDSWEKDETWPMLGTEWMDTQGASFTKSVRGALTPQRAKEGLCIFTLSRPEAELPDLRPICMLSKAMTIMPAADLGDVSDLLPPNVTWYDHQRQCFLDPSDFLDEIDRTRLLAQLSLLQKLNENEEYGSLIYSPDAHLCALLRRFADDLVAFRKTWRDQVVAGDETAIKDLKTRILASLGLRTLTGSNSSSRVSERYIRLTTAELIENPLISLLQRDGSVPEDLVEGSGLSLYLFDGAPFARVSAAYLLEPVNLPQEAETIRLAEQEISLLTRFDPEWNKQMAIRLSNVHQKLETRVGVSPHLLTLLEAWSSEMGDSPAQSDRGVTLNYPIAEFPSALVKLFDDMLGITDLQCIKNPFSDCLTIMEGAEHAPYDDPMMARVCLVDEGKDSDLLRYAIPPIAPGMLEWLERQNEKNDLYAPTLDPESFSFTYNQKKNTIKASYRIISRTRGEGTAVTNAITFICTYRVSGKAEAGSAFTLPAHAMPYVAVWPNVRMSTGQWKQYFVYAHRPDSVNVWTLDQGGWQQGQLHSAVDEGKRRQSVERRWQTTSTDRFPAYLMLSRGELSLGGLINEQPAKAIRHEPPAIAGIDFGSIATTVMIRQGEKVQPAALARCMHTALLSPLAGDDEYLADELLPKTVLLPDSNGDIPSFYSVMDMFSDDYTKWTKVFEDGHIYYRESMAALVHKDENSLYYNLKWGDEDYVLRCIRLFLKQVMMQTSLSARLWGSPSISWRVSMPNALPLHKQEAYLELMRGLTHEVARETGMPLTPSCPPVLYTTENQADGLYFLSRNEVNARSGYVNLDIGGSTTDISLWLNNGTKAAIENSITLGCRQMLFDSISRWHVAEFEADFANAPDQTRIAAQEITKALRRGVGSTHGEQKAMFLMDDFFAHFSGDIRKTMAQTRAEGHMSYVESLLLFNIGFLFFLCGDVLERALASDDLKPLLPQRMELCIAGNGGQHLKTFDGEESKKLCQLVMARLSTKHPLNAILPVQSKHPKQEVAMGLVSEEARARLQSSLEGVDRWNGTPLDSDYAVCQNLLHEYLPLFSRIFPQATKALMPAAFEDDANRSGGRLTLTALMEIETIFENERYKTPTDDMATHIRCFSGLKRLWRI
ncbi:MAG: hypothetical protein GX096_13490 [Clostridiales bacterium]|nr:hypothetical protein [Clostridiales bacterium]